MVLSGLQDQLKRFAGLSIASDVDIQRLIKEIQRSLLLADVDVVLVSELSGRLKKKSEDKLPAAVTRKEYLLTALHEELLALMGGMEKEDPLLTGVVLLVGLFGAGKTTTAGKLAHYYRKRGKKVLVVAADTYRAAAYEQLQGLAKDAGIGFFGISGEKDAGKVVKAAKKEFSKYDLVLIDSAGRDALNGEMLRELRDIVKAASVKKGIFVVSGDIGQNAGVQASELKKEVPLTGVIVTKLDSSGKGGGAVSSCVAHTIPLLFMGVGEKMEDLRLYDSAWFVGRLLGVPDFEGLLERTREALTPEEAKSFLDGDFDLEGFVEQMEKMADPGILDQLLAMMPGQQGMKEALSEQTKNVKKYKPMVSSMTKEEREHPEVISRSRISRISKGSGRTEQEIRELLKLFKQSKRMVSKFSGKAKERNLKKMFKQMGMNLPG